MKLEATKMYKLEFENIHEREFYTYKNTFANRIVFGVRTLVEKISNEVNEITNEFADKKVVLMPSFKNTQFHIGHNLVEEQVSLVLKVSDIKIYVG